MPHTPQLITAFSPEDLRAELLEAMSNDTPAQREIGRQNPAVHWGSTLQLKTKDVPEILSDKLLETARLGKSVTAKTAEHARVSTHDIPGYKAPLPPIRHFVPVGVAGGMGSLATVDLQQKLYDAGEHALKKMNLPKVTDQDHMGVVSFNIPHMIKDRTTYLNAYTGEPDDLQAKREHLLKDVPENPLNGVLAICQALKDGGAHFIVFPCNTLHAWYDIIAEKVKLPLLHIAETTILSLKKTESKLPENPKVGIIATTGTLNSQLYQDAGKRIEKLGGPQITWVIPDSEMQNKAMSGIYDGVKAGNMSLAKNLLDEVAQSLVQKGSHAIIDGCTEVNPAIGHIDYSVPQIDPATALAETAVLLSMALARLEQKAA